MLFRTEDDRQMMRGHRPGRGQERPDCLQELTSIPTRCSSTRIPYQWFFRPRRRVEDQGAAYQTKAHARHDIMPTGLLPYVVDLRRPEGAITGESMLARIEETNLLAPVR